MQLPSYQYIIVAFEKTAGKKVIVRQGNLFQLGHSMDSGKRTNRSREILGGELSLCFQLRVSHQMSRFFYE